MKTFLIEASEYGIDLVNHASRQLEFRPQRTPRQGNACLRPLHGFTLVELLVVIAIIALLIALLFPAVQGARESARRVQCQNNLKQLGLASHAYMHSQGYLPPSRILDHAVTWAVLILPYLEQQPLYGQWDISLQYYDAANASARTTPVATYFCPSRSTPRVSTSGDEPDTGGAHVPGARSDYAACGGDYSWYLRTWVDGYGGDAQTGKSFPFRANGAYVASSYPYVWAPPAQFTFAWTGRVTPAHVRDGTSNTIGFGEQYLAPNGSGMGYGSIFNGDNDWNFGAVAGPGFPIAPFDAATSFSTIPTFCFGSPHSGVCLFVMLDGRVALLDVTIDTTVLGNLASRNDGQVVAIPGQ